MRTQFVSSSNVLIIIITFVKAIVPDLFDFLLAPSFSRQNICKMPWYHDNISRSWNSTLVLVRNFYDPFYGHCDNIDVISVVRKELGENFLPFRFWYIHNKVSCYEDEKAQRRYAMIAILAAEEEQIFSACRKQVRRWDYGRLLHFDVIWWKL